MSTKAVKLKTAEDARLNIFLAQTYLVMSLGFIVTGLVATATSNNLELLLRISLNPWISFGLFIIQIAVVVLLSSAVMRMSSVVAGLFFILYAALTGLTLSSIFLVYTEEQIASVFWITAGTFFLISIFTFLFKLKLGSFGSVIFMLLLGWTIAWSASWLFPLSTFNWALTYIGIALFVGLTAYDTQRIREIGKKVSTHPARGGLVIIGALTLYLDFINLFLLILRTSRRRS
jgi:FtsH-binding integral membrane protein